MRYLQMRYSFNNKEQIAQLLQSIDGPESKYDMSDLFWLINTFIEAIEGKLTVELRYNESVQLIRSLGIITDAAIEMNCEESSKCILEFSFVNAATNEVENYSYNFSGTLVEENRNSRFGNFMKYYICKPDHEVIIAFTFMYK